MQRRISANLRYADVSPGNLRLLNRTNGRIGEAPAISACR
jgi:hypothetical protein